MTKTRTLTIQKIASALAEQGYIAILWHIDDLREQRSDLNRKQAWDVPRNVSAAMMRLSASTGTHFSLTQAKCFPLDRESTAGHAKVAPSHQAHL